MTTGSGCLFIKIINGPEAGERDAHIGASDVGQRGKIFVVSVVMDVCVLCAFVSLGNYTCVCVCVYTYFSFFI